MRSPSTPSAPFRPRSARSARLLAVLAALLVLVGLPGPHASGQTAAETAGGGDSAGVWDLGTLRSGRVYPTSVTARNVSCRGSHTFRVDVVDAPWLHITGPNPLREIPLGEQRTTDARVDLRGVAAGEYRGRLRFECITCPPPPVCALDRYEMEVRLKVKDPPRLEILEVPEFYFQDQTVDRLITFRVVGPEEMTVTELTAIWTPMVHNCDTRTHEISRSRPASTPVNTVTYFRIQESELDQMVVENCPPAFGTESDDASRPVDYAVAKGRWRLRAAVSGAAGVEILDSVDLCHRMGEEAGATCSMLLIRDDAQVLEVGCDRDFHRLWRQGTFLMGDGLVQGPESLHPKSGEGLSLEIGQDTLRLPLASGSMSTRLSYGNPFLPPGKGYNPELLLDFHVAPAVGSSDLPRGFLERRGGTRWDWSGLDVRLLAHHDAESAKNLAKDVAEAAFLSLATFGIGGSSVIGPWFSVGRIAGSIGRAAHRKVEDRVAKSWEDRLASLAAEDGIEDWRELAATLQQVSSEDHSAVVAYGGYEHPEFLDTGQAATRSVSFYIFNVLGQRNPSLVKAVTGDPAEPVVVEVDSSKEEGFAQALFKEVVYTAPPPDSYWPHLRFFVGGAASVRASNRVDQVREASLEVERRREGEQAPVRVRFGEAALHRDCPAYDPGPREDLDPTFLEIARPAIERPTQVVPAEDGS